MMLSQKANPALARERVLVTGAAGFIGSHLVDRLLALGAEVVGLDNFDPLYSPDEKRANLAWARDHPRFRLITVDCAEAEALWAELREERFDVIVHLAAKCGVRPSLKDPEGYLRANVVATQNVLEFARRHGIKRLVLGSSSSVYGNADRVPFSEDQPADRPVSPYAASKRACELLCATYNHLYGLGVLALRFFTVYGPRQRPDLAIRKFATLMLQGAPLPLYGDGTTARDYTWIDDIIEGVIAGADWTREVPGAFEVVNLGGNRTTSLDHLVELLAAALQVEPLVNRLPMQPGDVLRTSADVTKAGRLLGYAPRVSIEEGIPRFASWIENRMSAPAARQRTVNDVRRRRLLHLPAGTGAGTHRTPA